MTLLKRNKLIKGLGMSVLTKKFNESFIVFAHDLRTKDETKEFQVKAKSEVEAKQFFIEDSPQKYWQIQDIELA